MKQKQKPNVQQLFNKLTKKLRKTIMDDSRDDYPRDNQKENMRQYVENALFDLSIALYPAVDTHKCIDNALESLDDVLNKNNRAIQKFRVGSIISCEFILFSLSSGLLGEKAHLVKTPETVDWSTGEPVYEIEYINGDHGEILDAPTEIFITTFDDGTTAIHTKFDARAIHRRMQRLSDKVKSYILDDAQNDEYVNQLVFNHPTVKKYTNLKR